MRSLWQILVVFNDRNQSAGLTCDECFLFMEHIAEEAIAGADQESLLKAVQVHLAICPHCRDHHLRKLEAMEISIQEERNLKRLAASD